MLRVLPLIGYFIVLMSLIDITFIVLPLQLKNPVWELATIGSLADHFWAMLIGFGFILTTFFDEDLSLVKSIEITVITFLRWFFLFYGIFFIITAPLVLANTARVANLTEAKITEQAQAKETLITNLKNNLGPISNPQQLLEIGQGLGVDLSDAGNLSPDELRTQLQQQLTARKASLTAQSTAAQQGETRKLWGKSVRTLVQIILISTLCLLIFFKTREIGVELL